MPELLPPKLAFAQCGQWPSPKVGSGTKRGPKADSQRPLALALLNYTYISGYMDSLTAIEALASLSQASRLDAFKLLVRYSPEGLPAGEVARLLDVPQNTMSSHLGILQRAGLVQTKRQGRKVICHADLDCLRALMLFLVKDCCGASKDITRPLAADLALSC